MRCCWDSRAPTGLPAPSGAAGAWLKAEDGPKGSKYLFRSEQGEVLGYVLTGELCEERVSMDRSLVQATTEGLAA